MNPKTSSGKSGKKNDSDNAGATLEEQVRKITDMAARAQADLQNYKQRAERDAEGIRRFASTNVLLRLLPVFDDFFRLQSHLDASEGVREGLERVQSRLESTLREFGLKRMEARGETLDPHKHAALNTGPGERDRIIEVYEDGYELNDDVLRVAKVQVGDGSEAKSPQRSA